jgi:hypothetical protein
MYEIKVGGRQRITKMISDRAKLIIKKFVTVVILLVLTKNMIRVLPQIDKTNIDVYINVINIIK